MSALLADERLDDDEGGSAAQTGSLVHEGAAAFHRAAASMGLDARTEEGRAAIEAARQKFPEGSHEKAQAIFAAYARDPANAEADVIWVEQQVKLELPPAPIDPTGLPVVIVGTLDQIRRDSRTGKLSLWDIKTGSAHDGWSSLLHYEVQQATYLLAGRATLAPDLEPGGLIWTPGYEKKHATRLFPYQHTVEDAELLVAAVVWTVALIRAGQPIFRPGLDTCRWCRFKSPKDCLPYYRTRSFS